MPFFASAHQSAGSAEYRAPYAGSAVCHAASRSDEKVKPSPSASPSAETGKETMHPSIIRRARRAAIVFFMFVSFRGWDMTAAIRDSVRKPAAVFSVYCIPNGQICQSARHVGRRAVFPASKCTNLSRSPRFCRRNLAKPHGICYNHCIKKERKAAANRGCEGA